MLETVEQIEQALVDLMITHKEDLDTFHTRIDFVTEQAQKLVEAKEQELEEKYKNYSNQEEAEQAFLKEYKAFSLMVLQGVETTMKKDVDSLLEKITK